MLKINIYLNCCYLSLMTNKKRKQFSFTAMPLTIRFVGKAESFTRIITVLMLYSIGARRSSHTVHFKVVFDFLNSMRKSKLKVCFTIAGR